MFNNVYDFTNINFFNRLTENTVAFRCICLLPALEMANHTLEDFGKLISSFMSSNHRNLPTHPNGEMQVYPLFEANALPVLEANEQELKENRWKNVKNLTADVLGTLFFSYCAFNRSPMVAVASVLSFLVYAQLSWKKEDVGPITFWTGFGLKLLSHYKVKIVKSIGRGIYRSFQWITHTIKKIGLKIISGINHLTNALKSIAKVVAKTFKVTIQYPIKFINVTCKMIGKVASKIFSSIKSVGQLSVRISAAVAKSLFKGAELFFKHPYVGIALVGTVLCGALALTGPAFVAQMGRGIRTVAVTLVKGAISIGQVFVATIAKVVIPIFSALIKVVYYVASSLSLLALKLFKVIPTIIQYAFKAVWMIFSTIIHSIGQLFLKIIVR